MWFQDRHYYWNNKYLKWLAILTSTPQSSNFDIIYENKAQGIFVFGETINGKYAVWVWKVNTKLIQVQGNTEQNAIRPKELKLVDLQAGDQADQEYAAFLKTNFENSRLPEIIQKWEDSGYQTSYTVKAILPNPCGDSTLPEIDTDNLPEEGDIEEIFSPMDTDREVPQPQCITETTSSGDDSFNLLVSEHNGQSYAVWRKIQTTSPIRGEALNWYKPFSDKSPSYSWLAIALLSNCETYAIPRTEAIISVCDTFVSCYRDRNDKKNRIDEYRPLDLLDREDQRMLCEYLQIPANYENSPLKTLIEEVWYKDNRELKVVSYFDQKRTFSGNQESLSTQLKLLQTSSSGSLNAVIMQQYFLVEEKMNDGRKKYWIWYKDGQIKDSWYTQELHAFRDPWVGKLALADTSIVVLERELSDNIFTFITGNQGRFLWSWKLSPYQVAPQEYRVFKELADKAPAPILEQRFSDAFARHPDLYGGFLKKHVRANLNGTNERIIQLYKRDAPTPADKSPLELLSSEEGNPVIPPPLEEAFEQVAPLTYLIQTDTDQYRTSEGQAIEWYQQVAHFGNPWLAWLALVDNQISIVAESPEPITRVCFVLGANQSHLWSFVEGIQPELPPNEYMLIKGNERFGLVDMPLSSYVWELSENVSRAEQQFFLKYADTPDQFVLLDLYKPPPVSNSRIVLWRASDVSSQKMFRIWDELEHESAILADLVEGQKKKDFWSQLAERYQVKWYREKFWLHIGQKKAANLHTWLGKERLGAKVNGEVGVFLSPDYRDFGFAPLSNILPLVDDLSFIPKERDAKEVPSEAQFFRGWLHTDWTKVKEKGQPIWRANPLGYFDRL
ncbi:MAG: hypothetical protein AAFO96_08930 [Bacteroidota bacterium]